MVLVINLFPSFYNSVTSLESMSTKDVDIQFIAIQLLHELSQRKECESLENVELVNKTHRGNEKFCFFYRKPGHFAKKI